MPQRFEALTETLLKAGIAPRHVRRYVRELEDHLDDLIALQRQRGYDGEDAFARARALLGPDEELARAMTASGRFRSLSARAPWLVFGVLPPVAVAAGLCAFGFALILAAIPFRPAPHGPFPEWCAAVAAYYCESANLGIGPLAAVAMVLVAMRQRLSRRWLGLGVGLTAFFSALSTLAIVMPAGSHAGQMSVGMGTNLPFLMAAGRFALTAAVALVMYAVMRRPQRIA